VQAALAGNLQAVRSIARSVTLHDRGAGVDNGTHLVSALGNSRWAPGSPWLWNLIDYGRFLSHRFCKFSHVFFYEAATEGALANGIRKLESETWMVHLLVGPRTCTQLKPAEALTLTVAPTLTLILPFPRYDVTMKDIKRLLFNERPAKESKKRRRARWWAKHFGGCAVWHVCSAEPIRGTAPADALPENLLQLQVLPVSPVNG